VPRPLIEIWPTNHLIQVQIKGMDVDGGIVTLDPESFKTHGFNVTSFICSIFKTFNPILYPSIRLGMHKLHSRYIL
jgi:hypothetical protein